MKSIKYIKEDVVVHASDVVLSPLLQIEKNFIQHGNINVFEHSLSVACLGVYIAKRLHINVDYKSLVRGALLHDYFLYDWHVSDKSHRLHGIHHAKKALNNANRDFELNSIERDIIVKHMFPLNFKPPRYKESIIVCVADKICATYEILSLSYLGAEGNKKPLRNRMMWFVKYRMRNYALFILVLLSK